MSEPPSRGGFRDLARRIATAAVALPLLLAALFAGPPVLGVAVVAAAVLLGLWEFFGLMAARRLAAFRLAGLLLTAAFFLDAASPGDLAPPLWPAAALALLGVVLVRGGDFEASVPATAATLLGALYLGALGGTIAGLRVVHPLDDGPWRVVLLLAIVMGSDTLAYFTGSALGRRRLAPAISPGKTVEGALGGLLGGILGALAVRWGGLEWIPPRDAVLLGLGVSALGLVGDLFESLLKRWAGVKDSGVLFPGHGGMLDRLDSLLFGAPVLYYYFLYAR